MSTFLKQTNVNVLPLLAVSPDMNPSEHMWDYLSRKLGAKGSKGDKFCKAVWYQQTDSVWARVLFRDQSRFNVSHHDGGIRVFLRRR